MTALLWDGSKDAPATLLLAHGAGAGMDAPAMARHAAALAAAGLRVARFEFGYMAGRRTGGPRRPPPRAETLVGELRTAAGEAAGAAAGSTFLIGGKSMGGRVASLAADDLHADGRTAGLVCLGYPFHPPGRPEKLRVAHLRGLRTPSLIVQGTRDPFGGPAEVAGYALSPAVTVVWIDDGDHDLAPRRSVVGPAAAADAPARVARAVAQWAARL